MGRISDEDVQRVRDATDLVSLVSERVVLRQKGRLFWGLCPFHGEKTPSFKVDPATQLWHCFGCGRGGDAFGFVMESDHVDFPDAVRLLADRARIEIVEEAGRRCPRGARSGCSLRARKPPRSTSRCSPARASRARHRRASISPGAASAARSRSAGGWASRPGRGALVQAPDEPRASLGRGDRRGEPRARERRRTAQGPLLRARHVPDSRPAGTVHRVRRARDRQGRAEVPQHAPTRRSSSKSANLYAIDRAKATITSTGTARRRRGLHGRHRAARGGRHQRGRHARHRADQAAREAARPVRQATSSTCSTATRPACGLPTAPSEFVDSDVTPEAGGGRVELDVAMIPDGMDPADYVAAKGADALRKLVDRRRAAAALLDRPSAGAMGPRPTRRARPRSQGGGRGPCARQGLDSGRRLRELHRRPAAGRLRHGASGDRGVDGTARAAGLGRREGRAGESAPVADTPRLKTETELLAVLASTAESALQGTGIAYIRPAVHTRTSVDGRGDFGRGREHERRTNCTVSSNGSYRVLRRCCPARGWARAAWIRSSSSTVWSAGSRSSSSSGE